MQGVLQSYDTDSVNMISARNCFDDLIAAFAEIVYHLGQNVTIVHCPDFETGALKVLKGIVTQVKNLGPDASMQGTREDVRMMPKMDADC